MGNLLLFRQLEAWQEAHRLVLALSQVTKGFPGDERFGLTTQMRRAANAADDNPYSLLPTSYSLLTI
jgi:hypothetical protein